MKKLTLLSLMSALSFSSVIHAGGMGEANSCCSSYFSLEGGYTWNNIDGYDFVILDNNTLLSSRLTDDEYTGRFAAGVLTMFADQFAATAEVGWGYYGKTTVNPARLNVAAAIPAALTSSHTLSGFDALLGVAYVQPYYSVSFKAGALIQNMQNNTTAFYSPDISLPLVDSYNEKAVQTAVLPEIKLGAAYNFNENWSLTGSYLFALGASPKTTGVFNLNNSTGSLNVDKRNPTINTLLVGVQYTL
ncbi:outer membrane beta-barrel protein [Legionella worsleiensis]|uniref:OmpA-like transmembrane domain-containing protein n=1 Tax=Legionella worsleiensis TaxID=45076 RepID=A0A0W1A681_9GAMM|nr:outer membrane beta-barrel protein [Legionella worsleiensis]KTD76720.1 OmpA-like transmembrane domain-containing protein [Legionella worsleiensis]STY30506.1 OmpA-like transmembrane domain protein [Legionella worsleiensis]